MANEAIMHDSIVRRGYGALRQHIHDASYILFFIYCCLGLLLLPLYQFQISPDDTSYINIAHLYAIGDFHDAINGIWSPLISWLLVPFLLAKFQPLFSYKIVSLIISLFTFLAIRKLSFKFVMTKQVRFLISLAAIPMLLTCTFFAGTPDLLFLCISLYYLYYAFDPNYSRKVTYGLIIGSFGSLLYFSKSYGFDFFLAHFSLFTLIYYLKNKVYQERRNILIKYTLGLIIFLMLSGIWVYSISNKYQHFTISNAGEYNVKIDDSIGSQGPPMLYQGLLPLSYPSAVSAWDDPSYLTIDYEKSPRFFDWMKYQIVHIGENVVWTLFCFELFSIFSIVIVLIYIFYYYSSKRFGRLEKSVQHSKNRSWTNLLHYNWPQNNEKVHNTIFYSLITILLYTVGYELFHIETRYLWLDAILFLLLCAYYVQNNHFYFLRSMKLRQFLFFIIIFSFWLYPMLQLINHINEDRDIYMTSEQLQTAYHVKGNIASNNDGDSTNSWGLTLSYAYFLDSKYYGATQEKVTDEELQRELRKYHIDYYFVWNSTCRLAECTKIAEFEPRFLWTYVSKHLIIYKIKNNGSQ